ncbi:hypothetical protein FPOAC1_007177 [Fusarium poae]|uniref:hypothetical protein n=1 Tax=Fusarium poae TaxID=36050 RepID=UPI001CE9876D|nr:hypothetical protein FPOAC1_007177 [Fusarium poae]KAG8673858.1 hypothetical protein FPOAC1_007177 [Fusarium poae]
MIEYILTSVASPLTLQDSQHNEFQFDKLFNNATFAERPIVPKIVPKIKKRLHPGHPASQRVDIAAQGSELRFIGSTVDCAAEGLAAKKDKGNDLVVIHVGDMLTPGVKRRSEVGYGGQALVDGSLVRHMARVDEDSEVWCSSCAVVVWLCGFVDVDVDVDEEVFDNY